VLAFGPALVLPTEAALAARPLPGMLGERLARRIARLAVLVGAPLALALIARY
jgi:hypothetical protein